MEMQSTPGCSLCRDATVKKRSPALRYHTNFKVLDQLDDIPAHLITEVGSGSGKERQIFTQDFVRRDNPVGRKRTAKDYGLGVRGIINTGQGRLIERVGENSFHGVFLGTPYT
jgi:hypothetical protein